MEEEKRLRENAETRWGEASAQIESLRRQNVELQEASRRKEEALQKQLDELRQLIGAQSGGGRVQVTPSENVQNQQQNDAATLASAAAAELARSAAETAAALESQRQERTAPITGNRTELIVPGLSEMGGIHYNNYSNNVPFTLIADSLPKFSGSDVSQPVSSWISRVEDDIILYEMNGRIAFIAAKRALQGLALDWFNSQRGITLWEELSRRLEETFGRRVTTSDMHIAMHNKKRRANEDIISYIHDMELMGAQGYISESEIREYMIRVITNDDNFRSTLRTVQTRTKFLELLKTRERDKKLREGNIVK